MKTRPLLFLLVVAVGVLRVQGQTNFVYDQQSSTDETPFPYGAGPTIQLFQAPYGQSFTPTFSAVDFVQLNLNDPNSTNGLGATLFINLRANAINGPILAPTAPVSMTNGFTGVTTFSFSNTVPLTSGVTYFLEPVIQTGDLWNLIASEYNYPGGSAYSSGFPATGSDYWFREGIITVPEPSSVCLGLAGAGALVWWRMAFSRFRGR